MLTVPASPSWSAAPQKAPRQRYTGRGFQGRQLRSSGRGRKPERRRRRGALGSANPRRGGHFKTGVEFGNSCPAAWAFGCDVVRGRAGVWARLAERPRTQIYHGHRINGSSSNSHCLIGSPRI
ncbi:hypothetical protein NDU88_005868 [Pleurodeles waltl]|uniref:Uncharacterized protein n=1 Tax=Pleurodeles waltl TaxID=8319 RepID=A0AAV7PJD5_PLEWA|nr:hypothetical protein NDU88_005868 [Pleurodeles waltl]